MISLLQHDSPVARTLQTVPKCICKSEHHKVHALQDGGPLCGGGNGGAHVTAWQTDIGPINCAACLAIISRREA